MTRFPPQPCLLQAIQLTRTAYAQLVGQKFYAPKVFGRWQEKEGTREWRWRDLGLKIVSNVFSGAFPLHSENNVVLRFRDALSGGWGTQRYA
jgi:hypothetical protein